MASGPPAEKQFPTGGDDTFGERGLASAGLFVQMSLDKPQLLVGFAADLGEHIRRVGIPELCGFVDRLAHRPAERRKRRRERIDMFPSGEDLARVDRQCRPAP